MTNGNEPIGAVLTQSSSLQNETSLGLTKREQFAAMMMQGYLSSGIEVSSYSHPKDIAASAVSFADALIEALNK